MGEITMRNWDLRKFHVQVNLQSAKQQVWVLIWCVITSIPGLPNPIRQVESLKSHIRSYPPHCSYLHPPSLSFSSTTVSSSQNTKLRNLSLSLHVIIMSWHWEQHTPSIAYTVYSIHWVQYTLSLAYTKYSIHWVHHTPSTAYTEYSTHWVQYTPSTVYTESSIHWVQYTPSTAYTEYSMHQVQHSPSTAYTKYSIHWVQHPPKIVCLPFIVMITSWPLNVASAASIPPYTIDRHQPALH